MYFDVVKQFIRTLRALDAILVKAAQHAEAKRFDPNNFLTERLAPDMLPFTRQVQIACDAAKRIAASLSGKDAPIYPDNKSTLEQLRERIAKTVAYLETFTADDFASVKRDHLVPLPNNPARGLLAPDALLCRSVPNFFFHVSIAYALLRRGGVDIGKRDLLGDLPLVDM